MFSAYKKGSSSMNPNLYLQLLSFKELIQNNENHGIQIILIPKNVYLVEITTNIFDVYSSHTELRLSNEELVSKLTLDQNMSASEDSKSWVCQLKSISSEEDFFRFYAETGLYYCSIEHHGYFPKGFLLNVKKTHQRINLELSPKLKNNTVIRTLNMFDMEPVSKTVIEVYKDDLMVQRVLSDDMGAANFELDLMTTYLIVCKKDGFIELSQYFITSTSTFMEGITIRMIPKNRSPQAFGTVEAFIFFEESHNIEIELICPDKSILNAKTPLSQLYNVKFQDMAFGGHIIVVITFFLTNKGDIKGSFVIKARKCANELSINYNQNWAEETSTYENWQRRRSTRSLGQYSPNQRSPNSKPIERSTFLSRQNSISESTIVKKKNSV